MKIGLKYCGGCNPEYDRIALVDEIKKGLEGKIEFIAPEKGKVDIILAVCGCRTACADLNGFGRLEILTITGIEDAEDVIREINERARAVPPA